MIHPAASPARAFDPARVINPAQSSYLDAVRGLAAQLVLLHHAVVFCLPQSSFAAMGGGALGVLTFFLLSGFLITDSITSRLAQRRFSFQEFAVSRFSRIYLPYIPAILLVAVLDRWSIRSPLYEFPADYTAGTAIANVFMLQDFPLFQILRRLGVGEQPWFFRTFGSGRQFWTVSIEWWLYVTVGLATAMVVSGRRPSVWWWGALALAAIEPLYNLVGGPGDCLALAWLFGGAANLAYRRLAAATRPGRPVPAGWCMVATAGVAALAGTRLFFTHGRIYDAVFALLLAALLTMPMVFLLHRRRVGLIGTLGIEALSFHSYSLYLTHGSVVLLLLSTWGEGAPGWRGVLVLVVVANLFALPFAAAFELPHRQLRGAILRLLDRPGRTRVLPG